MSGSQESRGFVVGSLSPSDDEKRAMRNLASREAARQKATQREEVMKNCDDPRTYERDLAFTSVEKIRKDLARQGQEAKERVARAVQERINARAARAEEKQPAETSRGASHGKKVEGVSKAPQPLSKNVSGSGAGSKKTSDTAPRTW